METSLTIRNKLHILHDKRRKTRIEKFGPTTYRLSLKFLQPHCINNQICGTLHQYFKRLHTLVVFVPPNKLASKTSYEYVDVLDFSCLLVLERLSWMRERDSMGALNDFIPENRNTFPFKIGASVKELVICNESIFSADTMLQLLEPPDALKTLRIEVDFVTHAAIEENNHKHMLSALWKKVGKTLTCLDMTFCYTDALSYNPVMFTQWCNKLLVLKLTQRGGFGNSWLKWWFSYEHMSWLPELVHMQIGENNILHPSRWLNNISKQWVAHLQTCCVSGNNLCNNEYKQSDVGERYASRCVELSYQLVAYELERQQFESTEYSGWKGMLSVLWVMLKLLWIGIKWLYRNFYV